MGHFACVYWVAQTHYLLLCFDFLTYTLLFKKMPGMLLGQVVPNFDADTSEGKINFHEWLDTPLPGKEKSWTVMVSHPADFTPVCTTELGGLEKAAPEFFKRNVKLIALSCDEVEAHHGWIKDIKSYGGLDTFSYPIIADPGRDVANTYGMMDPDEKDAKGLPLTCRAVFVIADKKLKLSILYPATTGRNVSEILRVIDSLKLTAEKKVATPVNWKHGDKCMVIPSVKPDEAKVLFPEHTVAVVPSGKGYIRLTPQPQ